MFNLLMRLIELSMYDPQKAKELLTLLIMLVFMLGITFEVSMNLYFGRRKKEH
ncbi:hypothetical protein D3C75_478050 [compost metagenome]